MISTRKASLLLWRKDLRANALTLISVYGLSLLWSALSLFERWRFPLAMSHLLLFPAGAALFLPTAFWATERSQDTEVFFYSLPVSRRWLVRSRLSLTLLLILGVLIISAGTVAYLAATIKELAGRWRGGPYLWQVASFPWEVGSAFLLNVLFAVAIAVMACTWGPISKGAWRSKVGVMVIMLVIASGVGTVCAYYGVSGSALTEEVFVPEWCFSLTVLLLLLSGFFLSRQAFIQHAPLEHGRRSICTLAPWVLTNIMIFAGCIALNAKLSDTRFEDIRSVQEALSIGDQFVAVMDSYRWGRVYSNRIWQIEPTTGRAVFLRPGEHLKSYENSVVVCDAPTVWPSEGLPNRRVLDIKTGADRPLILPPAVRRLWQSGARVDVELHPISGNAILDVSPKRAFLVGLRFPSGKTFVYAAETGQLAPLRLPGTSGRASWCTWSEGGRAIIVSVSRRIKVKRGARGDADGHRQRLWRVPLANAKCQPVTPMFKDILEPVESDDGHYLAYFASSPGMADDRWNLMVTDMRSLQTWTIVRNFQIDQWFGSKIVPGVRWSPDSRHLAYFDKEKTQENWWLWDARSDCVRRVRLSLATDRGADPTIVMWHHKEEHPEYEQLLYQFRAMGWEEGPCPPAGSHRGGGEWKPGGIIRVTNMKWSPDSRYVALAVEEQGYLKDHPKTRWQSWQRKRVAVCVVDTAHLREAEGSRLPVGVTLITVGDAVFDDWAPPFSPHKLELDEQPQIEALAWARNGKIACLMQDGSLLHVDPQTGEVRSIVAPGGERR